MIWADADAAEIGDHSHSAVYQLPPELLCQTAFSQTGPVETLHALAHEALGYFWVVGNEVAGPEVVDSEAVVDSERMPVVGCKDSGKTVEGTLDDRLERSTNQQGKVTLKEAATPSCPHWSCGSLPSYFQTLLT